MRTFFTSFLTIFATACLLHSQPYNNVSYQSLYTGTTYARSINTNLPVGATPGSHEVSLTGGAVYNIPVSTPPGTNGMSPTVGISYNSQGGDGHLGMGWSVAGLSVISRTAKDLFHDTEVKQVQLDNTDRFAWDGNRLVATTGVYGANNTVYQTKSETFARITSYGDLGGGCPDWFKVETKSGMVYEYGHTTDSKLLKEGGTAAILWALSKAYDCFGNYIEYKYKSDERDLRIDEINYTGNANAALTPYNKIKFTYGYRTDKNTVYVGASSVNTNFLLTKITVTAEGGTAFKEYEFTYGFDNIHSYLREVQETGDNGTKLNATMFKYGDTPASPFTNSESSVISGQSVDIFPGDFNGDGLSDLLAATKAYSNGLKYHTDFKIYRKNTPSGTTFTNSWSSPTLPNDFEVVGGVKVPSTYSFMVADFNGEGRDDVMTTRKSLVGGYRKLDLVKVYYPNADASSLPDTNYTYSGTFQIVHPNGNYVHIGDFDGDMRGDYLTMVSNGSGYKAYISFDNSASKKEITGIGTGSYPATAWVISDFMTVLDYDGDGKSDVMVVTESITRIYTFKDFTASMITAEKIYEAGYPTKWHKIFLADFNGDSKTDLLTRGTTNNSWQTAISKGKDNTFATSAFTFNHVVDLDKDVLDIADFDGDSKTDIVHWWNNWVGWTATDSYIDMYYSRGNSFYSSQYYYNTTAPLVGNTYRNYIQGDYNGDGKTDLIARYHYQDPVKMLFFYKDSKNMMLEKAANGFNHLTTFQYKSLSEGGTFYTKGTSSSYPLMDLQMPLYAVSSVSESNGNGTSNATTYSYEKAKLHRKGRGFLGFEKTVASNAALNHKVTTEFEVNTSFYVNMLKQVTEAVLTTNATKSLSVYTNQVVSLSNGRYWQRVNNVNSGTLSNVPTRYVSLTYDANGNVTQESYTQTDFNNAGTVETGTTTHIYGTYCTWLPSKPTQTTITVTRTGQPAFTKTIARTFSATNGSLTQEIDFSGLAKAVTTTYQYNAFGNVTSLSTSATGLATRTVTSAFDAKGRFATSITNPLNQVATAVYSAKWGKPTSQTGVNGLTITHAYDAFGRMTSTTTPEGNTITTSYVWDVQGSNSIGGTTIVFYTNNIIPGRPDSKEWFDALGRSRKTETEGMGMNQWVVTQKTYDNRGNVATSTAPYFSGGSGVVTTYAYDDFNRQTSASNPAGTTTNSYSFVSGQYRVTVTRPDGTTASQTTDTAGKTVSATDNGGTLNYEYNSAGNQTKVKIGTTAIVTMGYDVYGRQTSLDDKDAGLTTYNYNAFGELASQTDANANTHTMAYDVMGRITLRVGPEGTTTYEYVTATNNGKNLLKKVTGFNGITQEYTYDAYNRMTQEKETVDGTAYTTNYAYNNFGDVTSMTFPSGFSVNNFYDAKGFHTDITNSNYSSIFDVVSLNAYGQYTGYILGNGTTTTKSYDTYGFPTNFTAGTKQNLSMSFNVQNGNLNSRTDHLKGKTETFAYDNLDRLTSSTVTGQGAIAVTYAGSGTTTGNIASKTSVGNYTYSNVKIHAVLNVSNPNGTVPTTTQDIAYTAYHQPSTVQEGIHKVTLTYGPDYERRKMVVEQNSAVTETRYYFNNYEKIVGGGTTTHLHYITCGAGLVAIVKRVGSTDTYHYAYTDHLGSVVRLTNPSGSDWEQNFDAWGRPRNPNDWTYSNLPALPSWIYRGYTGHEHLPQFNLVNMNGRLYDPLLGRMLSVDNNVQAPTSTQNYNRYSYVMNNPLKYKDPDGEFLLSFLIGGFKGLARGDGFLKGGWNDTWNEMKIIGGLFAVDGNKGLGGAIWEIASRFTWQLPQTTLGISFASIKNRFSHAHWVKYKYGATVVKTSKDWGGITLGSFIIGDNDIEADANNSLFQHEYGHYIQSQAMGPAYLSRVGIPSALSNDNFGSHDFHPVEQDANRRAFLYFNRKISGFYDVIDGDGNGWDFFRNPLDPLRTRNRGQVWDFMNSSDMRMIRNLKGSPKWYDYAGGGWGVLTGLWNAAEYNESIFGIIRF